MDLLWRPSALLGVHRSFVGADGSHIGVGSRQRAFYRSPMSLPWVWVYRTRVCHERPWVRIGVLLVAYW